MDRPQDVHGFSADRPISGLSEDLLGREAFAKSLANAIGSWAGRDSLVVALNGVWGSGKSSIKNMALDAMKQSGASSPVVVEFNPWQWAGQDRLHEAFFSEIALALDKADRTKAGKKRSSKWRFYGAFLKAGSSVLSGLSTVLPWLLMIFAALGLGSWIMEMNWLRLASAGLLLLCFAGGAVLKWGGTLSERLANAIAYYTELHAKSVEEIKADLKGELSRLGRTILVVMDDIDRLSREETRLLIQLVKVNADFPNIVYLLVFQRDIVEKKLESEELSGRDYLEKIVQVPFDTPQADQLKVEKILFSGLDKILEADKKVLQRFDQTRWGNIYIVGLRNFFPTLRSIYRYLSTFSFHVNLLKGSHAFEVNPIDLIALEVLRLFEPAVYSNVASNGILLTQVHDHDDHKDEGVRKGITSIIDLASERHKEGVKEIIRHLFPTVEWALGGSRFGGGFADGWFHDLRVCHPDIFPRYFQLAIPERDISQSELDDLVSKTNDREALQAAFQGFKERGLLDVVLNRLDSYKERIPIESALSFVSTLFDIADNLPEVETGFFGLGPDAHASRIIYWYLRQETDAERRGQILYEAMSKSEGFSLPARVLSTDEQRRKGKRDLADCLVTDSYLLRLKELFVSKLKSFIKEAPERIMSNRDLVAILYRWREWGDPKEIAAWIDEITGSEKNLLLFLVRMTREVKSQGAGDYVYRKKYRISLRNVADFVPVEVVRERLAPLDKIKLNEEERRSIDAFEKALQASEQGKSEDFMSEED